MKRKHLNRASQLKESGRNILPDTLQVNSKNDLAWFWLSKTYTDDRRMDCLLKKDEINADELYAGESHQYGEAMDQLSLY